MRALALTGQGDGLWLRDADGAAVRPPISWLDDRAADVVVAAGRHDGTVAEVYRRTGVGLFPGCHAPLLTALANATSRSRSSAPPSPATACDALVQRLTGVVTVDASDASLPFLDVRSRRVRRGCARAVRARAPRGAAGRTRRRPHACTRWPAAAPRCSDCPWARRSPPARSTCRHAPSASGSRPRATAAIIGTTLACEVFTDRVDPARPRAGRHVAVHARRRALAAGDAGDGRHRRAGLAARLHRREARRAGRLLAQSRPGASGVARAAVPVRVGGAGAVRRHPRPRPDRGRHAGHQPRRRGPRACARASRTPPSTASSGPRPRPTARAAWWRAGAARAPGPGRGSSPTSSTARWWCPTTRAWARGAPRWSRPVRSATTSTRPPGQPRRGSSNRPTTPGSATPTATCATARTSTPPATSGPGRPRASAAAPARPRPAVTPGEARPPARRSSSTRGGWWPTASSWARPGTSRRGSAS